MLRLPVEGFQFGRSVPSTSTTRFLCSNQELTPSTPGTSQPLLVPLIVPSLPCDTTHLLLTVRHLESDRYLQLEVPKEWRVSRLKQELLARFGLVSAELEREKAPAVGVTGMEEFKLEDLDGGSPEKAGGGKGKEKEGSQWLLGAELSRVGSNLGLERVGIPFFRRKSSGLEAQAKDSILAARKKSIGRAGTKVLQMESLAFGQTPLLQQPSLPSTTPLSPADPIRTTTSSPSTPLSPHDHPKTLDDASLPSPTLLSGQPGRLSRRQSVQCDGRLRLSLEVSDLLGSLEEKGNGMARAQGESDSGKTRGRRSVEELKEIELMRRYRLTNAVLGTCVDDAAIVGRKLVQFDLITTYFDRPLRSYHLPYLKKESFVYKRSSTVSKGTKLALGDRTKGSWHSRCIEIDDGNLLVLKSSQDSTLVKSYPLPPSRVHIERMGVGDDGFSLPAREAATAKKLIALDFADATSCVIRPFSERDFEDFMRVLGEEDYEFQEDGDDEKWRINAINLAHASRHHFFDSPSSRSRKKPRPLHHLVDTSPTSRARRFSSPTSISSPISLDPITPPRILLERRSQAWSIGGSPARRPSAVQEEEEEQTRSTAGDEIGPISRRRLSYPAVPSPLPTFASTLSPSLAGSGTTTTPARSPVVRGVEVL